MTEISHAKVLHPLLENYENLPENEKKVLRLKALLHPEKEPLSSFCNYAGQLGLLAQNGRQMSQTRMQALLNNLKAKRLLVTGSSHKELVCVGSIRHQIMIDLLDSPDRTAYLSAVEESLSTADRYCYFRSQVESQNFARRLRLELYLGNHKKLDELLKTRTLEADEESVFKAVYDTFEYDHLDPAWIKPLPAWAKGPIVHAQLDLWENGVLEDSQAAELVDHYRSVDTVDSCGSVKGRICYSDIEQGSFQKAIDLVPQMPEGKTITWNCYGMLYFLSGKLKEARQAFQNAMKRKGKRKKVPLTGDASIYYLLAQLTQPASDFAEGLGDVEGDWPASIPGKNTNVLLPNPFQAVSALQRGDRKEADSILDKWEPSLIGLDPLCGACTALILLWVNPDKAAQLSETLERMSQLHEGIHQVATTILLQVIQRLDDPEGAVEIDPLEIGSKVNFIDLLSLDAKWKRSLEYIEAILSLTPQGRGAEAATRRLAWLFNTANGSVQPLEQKISVKGKWSKGRKVALSRLYDRDSSLDYLIEEDLRVLQTLGSETYRSWGYPETTYFWDSDKTPVALIGHPAVYSMADPDLKLDLVEGKPNFVVKTTDAGYCASLEGVPDTPGIHIIRETATRYKVVNYTPNLVEIGKTLGKQGLQVPKEAKEVLCRVIEKAPKEVQLVSDVAGVDLPKVKAHPTPIFQLQLLDEGLKANMVVRPFGKEGPTARPGEGGSTLVAQVGGRQVQVRRQLKKEREEAEKLKESCPILADFASGDWEWCLFSTEESLEFLSDLKGSEVKHLLEWPEDQKLNVSKPVDFKQLSLALKSEADWFSVEGEIKIDEKRVLDFQELLVRIEESEGRFISLDDRTFIALERNLHRKLLEFSRISEHKGKTTKIHKFGVAAVEDLAEQSVKVKNNKAWKEELVRRAQRRSHKPELPTTLQAELRDYQLEGFQWLSRLGCWGAGACLADDMGLGKTIQALAAILEHSANGPTLVVAPTSVCHNWEAECKRFAPTLKPIFFAQANRKKVIDSLGPNDLLICSYGLMQYERDSLTTVNWQTIVLDEAQAIKNQATQRSKVAMELKGEFKMALTGTPIENHLGELWNLFRFLNPGLLGSHDSFQRRFAAPIARDQDPVARGALRRLIRPFILRRIKSEVLQELPPRTEQTILVEPSEEEASFYESLRRKALENLANLDEEQAGKRRVHILSEIMRLRRACCHPQLVTKETAISSAKMTVFAKTIESLRENKHKALVFSQFVGYLDLLRQHLDKEGIPYQYLDGSTPVAKRKQAVDDFQNGKGDLFLISLRAGGSGLNLTAADYVIHMDPWWNPAVEDQASDRAHRIGQKRPVTIYRLIIKGSIEEKILNLHKNKRDLAFDLLDGSNVSAKLSEKELMGLLTLDE